MKKADLEQKEEVKREYVLSCLQSQYTKADAANDRTNALRAAELLGKSIAMFTEKTQTEHSFKGYMPATAQDQAIASARAMDRLEDVQGQARALPEPDTGIE